MGRRIPWYPDWLAEGEGFEPVISLTERAGRDRGDAAGWKWAAVRKPIPRRRTSKLQPAAINETPDRLINSRAATTQNA